MDWEDEVTLLKIPGVRVFRCLKCKKTFQEAKEKVGCLVYHLPGECCHYGDTVIKEEEVNSWLSHITASMRFS